MNKLLMMALLALAGIGFISRSEAQDVPSQGDEALDDQIVTLQEDVTRLQDITSDEDLAYKRTMHKMLVELFNEKIAAAQKASDAQSAAHWQDEIKNLTAVRDSTWDQKNPILEDQQKIYMLKFDKIASSIDKALSKSSDQKVTFLKEVKAAMDKLKPLYVQRYQLWKDLAAARKTEDLKMVDDIYQKLKASREQERAIRASAKKDVLQMLDKNTSTNAQSL